VFIPYKILENLSQKIFANKNYQSKSNQAKTNGKEKFEISEGFLNKKNISFSCLNKIFTGY